MYLYGVHLNRLVEINILKTTKKVTDYAYYSPKGKRNTKKKCFHSVFLSEAVKGLRLRFNRVIFVKIVSENSLNGYVKKNKL